MTGSGLCSTSAIGENGLCFCFECELSISNEIGEMVKMILACGWSVCCLHLWKIGKMVKIVRAYIWVVGCVPLMKIVKIMKSVKILEMVKMVNDAGERVGWGGWEITELKSMALLNT